MVYVTSDWHGYPLERMLQLLQKAGFTPADTCYVLGDVIDRGSEGIRILKWLMKQKNVRLILGNHEAMMISCHAKLNAVTGKVATGLREPEKLCVFNWRMNGANPTLTKLAENEPETMLAIFDYLREAPLYQQVRVGERSFLLTHAGLGNYHPDKPLEAYTMEELCWYRPTLSDRYDERFITIFGHTPTHRLSEDFRGRAVKTETWIDIDTGAATGGSPMVLRLDDMQEFYDT